MQFSQPSTSSDEKSPSLSDAGAQVRERLSGRMKSSTPGQERRLLKTLERLRPAAQEALAGLAGTSTAETRSSFDDILAQISNA